jgi:hypothetical protein
VFSICYITVYGEIRHIDERIFENVSEGFSFRGQMGQWSSIRHYYSEEEGKSGGMGERRNAVVMLEFVSVFAKGRVRANLLHSVRSR